MKRSFIYLAVLTLFTLGVVVWLTPDDGLPKQVSGEDLLLPGIADQINSVSRVEIVTAGNQVVANLFIETCGNDAEPRTIDIEVLSSKAFFFRCIRQN